MTRHRQWAEHEDAALTRFAAAGVSLRNAARRLALTPGQAGSRARRLGLRFCGALVLVGGGCNREQALRGWATRRAGQERT